jgi:hypothetical protein
LYESYYLDVTVGLLFELTMNKVQQHVQLMECLSGAAWKNSSL